ncbi:aminotransferase [Gammaproteobacteria bacterium]|nr:aminotransferase [Gammaproteobacteria bacterium]
MMRNTQEWQQADLDNFLHPFTDYKNLRDIKSSIIVKGEGCYVFDNDGKRFLDGMAGLACVNIGYGRKELADVAARQISELSFFNSFFNCTNTQAIALAEKLTKLSPKGLNHVFFANSGSEANDTALRMVRQFWALESKPQKHIIISRDDAYHGSTVAAGALSGMPPIHAQAAQLEGIVHIKAPYKFEYGRDMTEEDFANLAATWLEEKIIELGADNVAAFFGEPIQGAGGGKIPPAGYWNKIQKICKKYDVLLVLDEVISGFGRTGNWFAADTYDINHVDIICTAKGITSGYIPLSAVMVNDRISNTLIEKGGEFYHGFTYSGHPVACAIALENIRIMEEENIIQQVRESTGPYFAEQLATLNDHPLVGEVRSLGLFAGIELVKDSNTMEKISDPDVSCEVLRDFCLDLGIIIRPIHSTIFLSPPLIISKEQIDFLVSNIRTGLNLWAETLP